MLTLTFNICPTPKQSARFVNGRAYQTQKIVNTEKVLQLLAKKQLPKGFVIYDSVPLRAEVTYIFAPLKSVSKKQLFEIIEGEQTGDYVRKFTKPDITDNLNKLLFDSLEGLIYANDSQISDFTAKKVYGKENKIILTISPIKA